MAKRPPYISSIYNPRYGRKFLLVEEYLLDVLDEVARWPFRFPVTQEFMRERLRTNLPLAYLLAEGEGRVAASYNANSCIRHVFQKTREDWVVLGGKRGRVFEAVATSTDVMLELSVRIQMGHDDKPMLQRSLDRMCVRGLGAEAVATLEAKSIPHSVVWGIDGSVQQVRAA